LDVVAPNGAACTSNCIGGDGSGITFTTGTGGNTNGTANRTSNGGNFIVNLGIVGSNGAGTHQNFWGQARLQESYQAPYSSQVGCAIAATLNCTIPGLYLINTAAANIGGNANNNSLSYVIASHMDINGNDRLVPTLISSSPCGTPNSTGNTTYTGDVNAGGNMCTSV